MTRERRDRVQPTESLRDPVVGEAHSGARATGPGPAAPGANRVIAGKYLLLSEIGRGGMGSVWRAEHLGWHAPVAVKLMAQDGASRAESVARFQREVRLAAGLRSPHVVQVLDHGVDADTRLPFIAMELLEGESLAQRLKREGPLRPAETFHVVSHLGRALTRAHAAGIVHRDLKPDNVFLVRNEDELLAKVLDFGLAKWMVPTIPDGGVSKPGSVLGTPFYMSPEQIRGGASIDHRTDLWSLSAIVVECLTGKRPFQANDFAELAALLLGDARRLPSQLGPVPPGFDAWFARATARSIDDRFQSARELVGSLAPLCGAETPAPGMPDSGSPRAFGEGATASVEPVSRSAESARLRARPSRSGARLLLGGGALVAIVAVFASQYLPLSSLLPSSDPGPAPASTVGSSPPRAQLPETSRPAAVSFQALRPSAEDSTASSPKALPTRAEPSKASPTRAAAPPRVGVVRPVEATDLVPVRAEPPSASTASKRKKTKKKTWRRARPKRRAASSGSSRSLRPSPSSADSKPASPKPSLELNGRRIRSSLPASD